DPERFVRIHRSTIVNVDRVRELELTTHGNYVAILEGGQRLTVSRSFRARPRCPRLVGSATRALWRARVRRSRGARGALARHAPDAAEAADVGPGAASLVAARRLAG